MTEPFVSAFRGPDDSPGFLLWQATMVWGRRLRAALEPLQLTHTQFVLLATCGWLGRQDETVTQVHIANHAKVDVMMVSQVLRTLETKGFVLRQPHPTDARARSIELTSAGEKLLKTAVDVVEQEDIRFFNQDAALERSLLDGLRILASVTPRSASRFAG